MRGLNKKLFRYLSPKIKINQIAVMFYISFQNVEKDHQIESLYNQLDEFKFPAKIELEQKNGATQTERVKIFSVNSDSGSSNRSHSSSPAG